MFVGEFSYSVYVLHYPLWSLTYFGMQRLRLEASFLAEAVFVVAVIGLAALCARTYDPAARAVLLRLLIPSAPREGRR